MWESAAHAPIWMKARMAAAAPEEQENERDA